jgi:serine/threonine protein kinase
MTKIAGRYEIKAKLGEGGMGVVYRAYDPPPMDREVAVKTLHAFEDPLALELFFKEGTALKTMSHPNIVEIFDMGESEMGAGRQPFFVMPLLHGQTLDELVRKAAHRLTVDRVVEIFVQTCRGLQAAHERGLVHRDLKPSNIFVMNDDAVKIIDFGVAHTVHAKTKTTGYDKGTLLYMAPEQVQHKPVSVQSDVYALGVTLYEALTRRQPFRNATEDAVIQAILTQIPPPASDLNPAVSHNISRVVHKAMAKQPWNRFDSARDFGETLLKAHRNEPIAIFDPARIQPRIQTATKALEKGDYQFAGEIISELEAEGNIDPQISLLRAEIDQIARQKTVAQLLESARARYEEEEDPLALQKLQEVLQLDPTNVKALGLKSKIEDRRSERQIEKWIQLAQQHASNRSYGHAREALQNALTLRPKDPRASKILKEIETDEQEYMRLRREKTDLYNAAVNAWKNGEVSQALSQMKVVLDLDRRAPDVTSPDAANTYQSFFNKIRSEHEAINNGYAEARRHLADKDFAKALELCLNFLEKYPGQAVFQALKFDIEEQQRQRLSAFIAETDRKLEAEADLDARVHLVREAATEFPGEDHFKRLIRLLEDKRDLVNSIVERAKLHESGGQIAEALSDLETLRTIYGAYPGLKFEKERLQKRLEQQTRDAARTKWVRQIDAQLQHGDWARAGDLLDKAEAEFPGDAELAELRKLAAQGVDRSNRADELIAEGEQLCTQGQFEQGVDLLKVALQLDDRTGVRMKLRDLLVGRAQEIHETDWQNAEVLVGEALELDPNHALAKSLRSQVLDKRREMEVGQFASQARRLQADGEIDAAMTEVERGLTSYPTDARLGAIKDALKKEIERVPPPEMTRTSSGSVPVTPVLTAESPDAGEALEKTRIVPPRSSGGSPASSAGAASSAAIDGKTEILPRGPRTDRPAPRESERPPVAPPVRTQPKQQPSARPKWLWPAVGAAAVVVVIVIGVMTFSGGGTTQPPQQTKGAEPAPPVPPPDPNPQPPPTPPTGGDPGTGTVPTPGPTAGGSGTGTGTPPTGGPTGPQPGGTGTSPGKEKPTPTGGTPPAAAQFAKLRLIGMPAGTRMLMDGRTDAVGADGNFARDDVKPGVYELQLQRQGFDLVKLTGRVFAAGATVTIAGSEISWTAAVAIVQFQAPPGATVSIMQGGKEIQNFTTKFDAKLPPGTYDIVSEGTVKEKWTEQLSVAAGETKSYAVRVIGGMERFTGFSQNKDWHEHPATGFIFYERTPASGRFTFTVRVDRTSPISNNSRLEWVVGYVDDNNYVKCGLDQKNFYRTVKRNGVVTPQVKPHNISFRNVAAIHLDIQVGDSLVVTQYRVGTAGAWATLDEWKRGEPSFPAEPFSRGRFGLYVEGDKTLAISYFKHYPGIR